MTAPESELSSPDVEEGDENWDEDEEEDEFTDEIIRAKWSFDGATTLSEAASMLRAYADDIEEREREGWQLREPIKDDYGFIFQSEKSTV